MEKTKMLLKFILFPVVFCAAVAAQAAYIGYLYPAGGRAGEEVEILVGGQGMGGPNEIIVTGQGVKLVKCEAVRGIPYPSGSQRRYLNQWVRRIQAGDRSFLPLPTGVNSTVDWQYHPWYSKLHETTALQYELVTHFLYVPRNSLQMSPSIAQNIILKLKIDKNAEPGRRELRLAGSSWVSNPVPFYVGTAPEINEPRYLPPPEKKKDGHFVFPCVLNGQILPGETDRFWFEAKKGEKIFFDLKGRVLQPFVGDGVPGYFQAVLEVTDENGRQLAFADDRYFQPDPVLEFTAPADGRYQLLVRDALYRGRQDFVYRIEVDKNERPYVIAPPPQFAVTPLKLEAETEKQTLSLPVVIHSSIAVPGAVKEYSFYASAGEKLVADVWARRLGSPIDGMLEIYDPSGKRIVVCDDVKRERVGVVMQHADPTILFTAEKSGKYRAVLRDNAGKGGKDYQFYLRLDRPRPDFRVYGYPSALEPAMGARGIFGVIVERYDGFDGPVTLQMDSPHGYRLCGEVTVPAGCTSAAFTLESFSLRNPGRYNPVVITASANGITHRVHPATEAMQAFAYTHLVPNEGDFIAVRGGKFWSSRHFDWQEKNPSAIKLFPGSCAEISIRTGKSLPKDYEVTGIALKDQPLGVLVEDVKMQNGVITAKLRATAETAAVTVNQIFYINIRYTTRYRDRKTGKMMERKTISVGILPSRRLIVSKAVK